MKLVPWKQQKELILGLIDPAGRQKGARPHDRNQMDSH